MGYGNNNDRKNWQMRAVALAVGNAFGLSHVSSISDPVLTAAKRAELTKLFSLTLCLMREMVQKCFSSEPLADRLIRNAQTDYDQAETLESKLIAIQKSGSDTLNLNQVWCEQARMRVKPALIGVDKLYFSRLIGSLCYVDSKVPADTYVPTAAERAEKERLAALFVGPPAPPRMYFHVPFAIQDDVTKAELSELREIGEAKSPASDKDEADEAETALSLFQRVILNSDTTGLSPNQVRIVRGIHAKALEQHTPPEFGEKDEFTLQLHLDYRMLPAIPKTKEQKEKAKQRKLEKLKAIGIEESLKAAPKKAATKSKKKPVKNKSLPNRANEAIQLRSGEAAILADDQNVVYRRFLDIAGVEPRSPRIRIPVSMTRKHAKHINEKLHGSSAEWASLIVELTGRNTRAVYTSNGKVFLDHEITNVGVRLVCGKPAPEYSVDLKNVVAIVGRDFGYANTVSLSVAISETPIDLSMHAKKGECEFNTSNLLASTKEEAKVFFETHVLPDDVKIVEQLKFEGRNFLAKIAGYCDRIDKYKSRIDLAYASLAGIKAELFSTLNCSPDEMITCGMKNSAEAGARVSALAREFFQKLGLVNDLKKARRALYDKIKGLKKTWFGFLANKERALVKKYNAVLVREDLTVVAIETTSPKYKGRTFNKMIGNGSKGQYQRAATDKCYWDGIPEIPVGSWYTSVACNTHSKIASQSDRDGEDLHLRCCGTHVHADLHASETIATYLFLKPKETKELPCVVEQDRENHLHSFA